jgi:hypothetical protein
MGNPVICGEVINVTHYPLNDRNGMWSYVFVNADPNDLVGNVYDIDMSPYNCLGMPDVDWGWDAEFVRLSCVENGHVEICFLVQHGNNAFHAPPEVGDKIEIMVN